MEDCWIGIDVGTHGIRGLALSATLGLMAERTVDVPTYFPQSGWAIQQPRDLESGLDKVLSSLTAEIQSRGYRIQGIGFDGTASLLAVTSDLQPRSEILLWMDLRAQSEAQLVSMASGWPESAELPWAKALWMAEHRLKGMEQTFLVEVADWLCGRLTGQLFRNRASALLKWHGQGSQALPVWANAFPQVLAHLPEHIASLGTPVGHLKDDIRETWGIPNAVPIIPPLIDAYAAALGSGAVHDKTMALILGTSACELFHGTFGGPVAGLWGPFSDPYEQGVDVMEAGQPSVGSVVDWISRVMAPQLSMEQLDTEAGTVSPGSDGVRLYPAFQGVRSPWPDAQARGEIRGLGLEHTVFHLLRAAYEGTACDIRRIMDLIPLGENSTRILATGGGSQSQTWMQIIADICQLPVDVTDSWATPRGAALLAMQVDGVISDAVPILERVVPDEYGSYYQGFYQEYCTLFPLRRSAATKREDRLRDP